MMARGGGEPRDTAPTKNTETAESLTTESLWIGVPGADYVYPNEVQMILLPIVLPSLFMCSVVPDRVV